MNIFMSYNNEGFEEAKKVSDPKEFSEEDYPEMLSYLVSWAGHDQLRGFCDSYQIYNELGQIIIDSNNQQNSEAVA